MKVVKITPQVICEAIRSGGLVKCHKPKASIDFDGDNLSYVNLGEKMKLIEKHKDLIDKVISQNYYSHNLYGLDKNCDQLTSQADIYIFWNKFYHYLPDNPSIRKPIFFEICDLIERNDEYE